MQISVSEFLEKVSKLKTDKEKIEALKYNDSLVLRSVLQGAFDPNVKWLLPEGTPPYKSNELVDQEHIFIKEVRKLPYFIEGFYPQLNQNKREMMFVEMLESIDKNDAIMLCHLKDKKLPWKGITGYHVQEAFPDLMPNYVYEPNKEEDKETFLEKKDKILCPHCGTEGSSKAMMNRYHFDNCKKKPVLQQETITNDVIEIPDSVHEENKILEGIDLTILAEKEQ